MQRVKLCFICYEYPPGLHGGVGTFTQVLARALVRAGHEVRVAGVYYNDYPSPDYEEDEGVRIWRLRDPGTRLGWIAPRYQLYRLIRRWADAGEVDLVEAPDCYGWFAGWPRMPVPLTSRAHGSLTYFAHELGRPAPSTEHRLERWSYRRVDAWSAVSRHAGAVTRSLFQLPRDPDAVLFNPVTIPAKVTPYTERPQGRVVFSGTLTKKKGIVSLIDAWPAILAGAPEAQLDVYGKDQDLPDGTSMQQSLLGRLPAEARRSVVFHGHVSRAELFRALAESRVAALPSYTETCGYCAVEAMACGCPTVYTTLTCGPEVVRHGLDGLLADPDRPNEIAAAVLSILQDPALGERLSRGGRARVQRDFAVDSLVTANEQFFAGLIRSFHERSQLTTTAVVGQEACP